MKTIAVIEADLNQSPIGTASRLAEELANETVLRRTVRRALEAKLGDVHLVCPADQRTRVEQLVAGLDVAVQTHNVGPPPYRQMVRTCRKWALDSWRGGISGSCAFDESVHCAVLAAIAKNENADAVVSIPAAAVLLDPTLARQMADHFALHAESMRLTFAQAPPGMVGTWYMTSFLEELGHAGYPPGALVNYAPEKPQFDFVVKDCCYKVPPSIAGAWGRLLADTRRAAERCNAAIADLGHQLTGDAAAVTLAKWLRRRENQHLDDLPQEVEIELTTDDQWANSTLRPRGKLLERTATIDPQLVEKIAREMAAYDDSAVVLGGFGEPLLHPQFEQIVAACKQAGIFALAIRTNALAMDQATIDMLMKHDVDVVTAMIDTTDAEIYRRLHGLDGYEQAVENTRRLAAQRIERTQIRPIVVPEMIKTKTTYGQMEAFFDEWIRTAGWAVIAGYSDYGRLLPDEQVMNLAPPVRAACVRIRRRTIVLADGRVLPCDQDPRGTNPIGNLASDSLASIWQSPEMQNLRASHDNAHFDPLPICPPCTEWHRP